VPFNAVNVPPSLYYYLLLYTLTLITGPFNAVTHLDDRKRNRPVTILLQQSPKILLRVFLGNVA